MLTVYNVADGVLRAGGIDSLGPNTVWIDLLDPSDAERATGAAHISGEVPTREDMQEIEASSRIYRLGETLYLTTPVLLNADSADPRSTAVAFVVTAGCLITVRHGSPQSFSQFAQRAIRQRGFAASPEQVLLGLLEAMVDRLADVLERIGGDLDALSHDIFRKSEQRSNAWRKKAKPGRDLQTVLRNIGQHGDLTSKARESLLGMDRVIAALQAADIANHREAKQRIKTLARDARSLGEHTGYIGSKVTFLLDATLGMINIEQNNTIKILSVVAVVFLPPTLVASVYGMNFEVMPELAWDWGYPLALLMMLILAILPYWYFKRRGWL